jgi:hypothetical protein
LYELVPLAVASATIRCFKKAGMLSPVRPDYTSVDRALQAIGWGDSLLVVARKPVNPSWAR